MSWLRLRTLVWFQYVSWGNTKIMVHFNIFYYLCDISFHFTCTNCWFHVFHMTFQATTNLFSTIVSFSRYRVYTLASLSAEFIYMLIYLQWSYHNTHFHLLVAPIFFLSQITTIQWENSSVSYYQVMYTRGSEIDTKYLAIDTTILKASSLID